VTDYTCRILVCMRSEKTLPVVTPISIDRRRSTVLVLYSLVIVNIFILVISVHTCTVCTPVPHEVRRAYLFIRSSIESFVQLLEKRHGVHFLSS